LYQTFVLEARFGFNKTTLKLWLVDAVKSSLIGLAIGLPIVYLVLWLMGAAGAQWWVWAWGAWVGISLLLLWLFPTFIAPLFNRFMPLEDQTLKDRVTALMTQCGFKSEGQTLTLTRNRRTKRRWTRIPTQPTIPHQAKDMKRQEAPLPWQISKP
jgi:STE24 endopeptidase